jgi:hypothetical protein
LSAKNHRQKIPELRPLEFGTPYCELCKDTLRPGQRVAWWKVPGRWAVYCATCHHENVRSGRALQ